MYSTSVYSICSQRLMIWRGEDHCFWQVKFQFDCSLTHKCIIGKHLYSSYSKHRKVFYTSKCIFFTGHLWAFKLMLLYIQEAALVITDTNRTKEIMKISSITVWQAPRQWQTLCKNLGNSFCMTHTHKAFQLEQSLSSFVVQTSVYIKILDQ